MLQKLIRKDAMNLKENKEKHKGEFGDRREKVGMM